MGAGLGLTARTRPAGRLGVAEAEAIEDAWRPGSRPDLAPGPDRWGAEPYPCGPFLDLLSVALDHLGGPAVFADLGAGTGTKVLLAAGYGCPAWGVDAQAGYVAVARQLGADVRLGQAENATLTGTAVVFVNALYRSRAAQARLEAGVRAGMDPGAVLISVNYAAPPPAPWLRLAHDPAAWRGAWAKPGGQRQ